MKLTETAYRVNRIKAIVRQWERYCSSGGKRGLDHEGMLQSIEWETGYYPWSPKSYVIDHLALLQSNNDVINAAIIESASVEGTINIYMNMQGNLQVGYSDECVECVFRVNGHVVMSTLDGNNYYRPNIVCGTVTA